MDVRWPPACALGLPQQLAAILVHLPVASPRAWWIRAGRTRSARGRGPRRVVRGRHADELSGALIRAPTRSSRRRFAVAAATLRAVGRSRARSARPSAPFRCNRSRRDDLGRRLPSQLGRAAPIAVTIVGCDRARDRAACQFLVAPVKTARPPPEIKGRWTTCRGLRQHLLDPAGELPASSRRSRSGRLGLHHPHRVADSCAMKVGVSRSAPIFRSSAGGDSRRPFTPPPSRLSSSAR